MASPFRVFRKNVKPLLVIFGCLLILAWVGGSSLTTIMGPRGGGGDVRQNAGTVAVSWEGGSLTNQELDNLVVRRAIVRAFLDHVEGLGAQSSLTAGLEPPPLPVMPLRLPETAQEGVERSVVQTALFADAARQAGMSVDDNAIVQYLRELGRGRVSRDDMRAILEGFRSNNPRVSIDYVFDGLRDELLARNYLMSNMYAAQTVTPQQRWQDWLQVNDRVVVEAASIPVEPYLVEVKEPSDAELKAFFDEHKDNEHGPDLLGDLELPSARPGFRIPRKIGVQFLQANFNELVNKTEGEVTEEEIAKYYEENKDLFVKADTGLLDDAAGSETTPPAETPATESAPSGEEAEATAPGEAGTSAPDAKTDDADQPGTGAAEVTGSESAPAAEGAPADESAPENPSAEESPATPPADAPPADTPPAAEESGDNAAPGEADQSSRTRAGHKTVFRQVVFLQEQGDAAEAPAATPGAESGDTTGAAETNPPADTGATSDAAPATEGSAEPAPPESTATPPAESTAPPATGEPPAAPDATATPPASAPSGTPPAAEKPKEYQPLDEVRDLIRRELAHRRANEKIVALMDEVQPELTREFEKYLDQVLRTQSSEKERPAPPAALADLAPLAAKHGLVAGKLDAMPWLEFRDTPVGKTMDPDTRFPLSSLLFGRTDRELYQPILTVSTSDGDRYITMKTSDAPSRVPDLADAGVRDQVVRAWKLREAAKLALKDAQKQAADAQKAGSSLVDFFAEKPAVQVERADPFAYYTRGDVPGRFELQRFRLSQPEGIVAAGPELLDKVFSLKDGEVGAALNHDQSIAYVVRVVEHQDAVDELRTAYLAEANSWDGLPAMTEQHITRSRDAIVANIAGTEGIDWQREPDKLRDDSETTE